jgi:tripartite-type tricarboxylate transporter receptor subunit TctC
MRYRAIWAMVATVLFANTALNRAMRVDAIAKRMAELGADLPAPDRRTPQALAELVRSEVDRWVPVIRATGLAE